MRILHYSLGLPPYRSGGLTKYSIDLMKKQIEYNQQVFLLFPGHYTVSKNTKIKFLCNFDKVKVYEIINPLPVSLLGGIIKPELFMQSATPQDIYITFLKQIHPDIIHVHTFMGIHKDFFSAAKKLKIKIVYSSHDYFGLCPKVNLIDSNGEVCSDFNRGLKCIDCNVNAYSLPLIYLMQSKSYRKLKDSKVVKLLRARKKGIAQIKKNDENVKRGLNNRINDWNFYNLRKFYLDLFKSVDYFHFNSQVAKSIFNQYINTIGEVIPITHGNIEDNRRVKEFNKDKPLRITFIGPLDKYKGFPLLRKALNILIEKGQNFWELNIYGNSYNLMLNDHENKNITFKGKYHYKDLKEIFLNTDVLIIPSVWKETFAFIGLEAMSFGVPVLISENVGFQDLIENQVTGIVFKSSSMELSKNIEKLIVDRDILRIINENICKRDFPLTMDIHTKQILFLYEKLIGVY